MARAYHSASSDAVGQRCELAWFYRYVDGRKDPEAEWQLVKLYKWDEAAAVGDEYGRYVSPDGTATVTARARSAALGKALHTVGERWYQPARVTIDWRDLPGQIFLSGVGHLPHPTKCHDGAVEVALGDVRIEDRHGGKLARVVDGIKWVGSRDLVACAPGEYMRMGVDAPDGWALIDYKSAADLTAEHLLTSATLQVDYAANLYALATCEDLGIDSVPCRWVYFETKRVRRAMAVDTTITRSNAFEAVEAASARSKHLDTLRIAADAVPNTDACEDYGGCPHHANAGGPCRARRPIGATIQAHTRKEKKMVLDPKLLSRFKKNGGGEGAPPATEPAEPDTTETDTPPAEPVPVAKKGRGRPKGATKAVAVDETPPPETEASAFERTMSVQGEHGPLFITGDARDVCDAYMRVMGG